MKLLAKRLLSLVGVLFCVISITFLLIRISPGGPFDGERKIPEAIEKQLLAKKGENIFVYSDRVCCFHFKPYLTLFIGLSFFLFIHSFLSFSLFFFLFFFFLYHFYFFFFLLMFLNTSMEDKV